MSEEAIKEYSVPEEIADYFYDYLSAEKCRKDCIKSLFKAKRAIYYGRKAIKAERTFWEKVRDVYPEFDEETLIYDSEKQTFVVRSKNKK